VAFDVIARDFLKNLASGGTTARGTETAARGFMAKLLGPDLARLTYQHLLLVLLSVGIAILIAVPIAIAVSAMPRARAAALTVTSLMQTVPSLALLAVLISLTGTIGTVPALIALTLYSLLPIMSNTVTGLAEVPDGLRNASTALGMTPSQSLRYVQLPLALPTLIAGVRTAMAIAIGTATIAAFIGAGGYGERIVTGLALNDRELLMAGAIPAALLALLSEGFFELLQRWIRPTQTRPSSAAPEAPADQ
jgi:osmoprotectant transport system permease protein